MLVLRQSEGGGGVRVLHNAKKMCNIDDETNLVVEKHQCVHIVCAH